MTSATQTPDLKKFIRRSDQLSVGKAISIAKQICNGLAVFDGRELISFDIFGNREVYVYYFDKLVQDALGRVGPGTKADVLKQAEAFYRLDELLDEFESPLLPG